MHVKRFENNPIIQPDIFPPGIRADNINGPSVFKYGGYYWMLFAHHSGRGIRLAISDKIDGKWRIYRKHIFSVDDTPCRGHIASPDVHIVRDEMIVFYHGFYKDNQYSFSAWCKLDDFFKGPEYYQFNPNPLTSYYLKLFKYNGNVYGISMKHSGNGGGQLLMQNDFNRLEKLCDINIRMRHCAPFIVGDDLYIIFSRGKDRPERLLINKINMKTFEKTKPETLLSPDMGYEGGVLKIKRSMFGAGNGWQRELRDPCVFQEDGRIFVFYSAMGEANICGGELIW